MSLAIQCVFCYGESVSGVSDFSVSDQTLKLFRRGLWYPNLEFVYDIEYNHFSTWNKSLGTDPARHTSTSKCHCSHFVSSSSGPFIILLFKWQTETDWTAGDRVPKGTFVLLMAGTSPLYLYFLFGWYQDSGLFHRLHYGFFNQTITTWWSNVETWVKHPNTFIFCKIC